MDNEKIKQARAAQQLALEKKQAENAAKAQIGATVKGASHVAKTIVQEAEKSRASVQKVEVTNPQKVEVKHTTDYTPLLKPLEDLLKAIKQVPKDITFPEQDKVETVSVSNLKDYSAEISDVIRAIKDIEVSPNITVPAANVTVPKTDLSPLNKKLDELLKALKSIKPAQATDTSQLESAVNKVRDAINGLSFPVPNYVLPFKDTDGKATQVQLNSDGSLPITASISTGSLATAANQTNGTQKTQLVDSLGNGVTVTGNKLDVNATASLAGDAIPATGASTAVSVQVVDGSGNQISSFGGGTQYTEGDTDASITGTAMMMEGAANTLYAAKGDSTDGLLVNLGANNDVTVSGTVAATQSGSWSLASNQSVNVAQINGVATTMGNGASGTGVQRVTIASDSTGVIIARGAAAVDAAVSGNPVYIGGRASTATPTAVSADGDAQALWLTRNGALNVADGGGSLTVDGTVAVSGTVTVDGSGVTQPVSLASVPSHAVTNAGTFAVQDTNATSTSTQTSVANSVTSVTLLSANASRKSATIYNDDTAASLYVKFGTTASTTSFKIKIAPGGYYEFPYPIYTGRVDAIASAATGSARICEET